MILLNANIYSSIRCTPWKLSLVTSRVKEREAPTLCEMHVLDGISLPESTRDEVGDRRVKVSLDVLLVHDRVGRHPQEGTVLRLRLVECLL